MLVAPLLFAVCVPLHIDLEFDPPGALPLPTRTSLVDEAARIWSPYGVLVREGHTSTSLSVHIAGGKSPGGLAGWASPLGETAFSGDGAPGRVLSLFYDAAVQMIAAARLPDESGWRWTVPHRHDLLGRVLGRALAHELGHYLLQSREHSALGLMRAQHPVTELLDDDRRRFGLMPDQVKRLRQGMAGGEGGTLPASGPCS